MLRIETQGSWRRMGEQVGEAYGDLLRQCLDQFAPWLAEDVDRYRPAIGRVRSLVAQHCPEVNDETEGMASGAGMESDLMLGLRHFNQIREYEGQGCTGLFLATTDHGPLLGRTCDIEPGFSAEIQLARVCRPDTGVETATVTYLPLTGGIGLNAFGVALTGSSASATGASGGTGVPGSVLNHLILSTCRTVSDVLSLAERWQCGGKGAVELVCDAAGASALLEVLPGQTVRARVRHDDRDWQACANFCFSPDLRNAPGPDYIGNAYARYGRIAHMVGEGFSPRSLDGMKQTLLDVSQPGLVCHEPSCSFRTAYTFVAEPAGGRLHVCPGHPAENEYFTLSV